MLTYARDLLRSFDPIRLMGPDTRLFSNSGLVVKRFFIVPAGFTVLFAVDFPPHHGFRRRWWINV